MTETAKIVERSADVKIHVGDVAGAIPETVIRNVDRAGHASRIIIGTPSRGLVRIEWHASFLSMITPTNWGAYRLNHQMSPLYPTRFQVADAQNIITRECLAHGYEWLLLLEDDVLVPPTLFVRLNSWMQQADTPVVSGLYHTKSDPSTPHLYRKRATGPFLDWEPGEVVWCDGVPTGCLLVHSSILRALWDESEPYFIGGQETRHVFEPPAKVWVDPESGVVTTSGGTSDLEWCSRIMRDGIFKKAGWSDYEGREFPFAVDTRIKCGHISQEGDVYPPGFRMEG